MVTLSLALEAPGWKLEAVCQLELNISSEDGDEITLKKSSRRGTVWVAAFGAAGGAGGGNITIEASSGRQPIRSYLCTNFVIYTPQVERN